ncbi:hypothetical protein Pma05_72700 [Plantactinospora mayteni]|uniref:Uncharacterized protein n=1 Tax=Plantactinospora mayteni TaxID=566021 RepID=A0ABQ4F1C2_9ACTN|nr:hypothetical protein Pma05_72700 [Plantactinospora mayteni]
MCHKRVKLVVVRHGVEALTVDLLGQVDVVGVEILGSPSMELQSVELRTVAPAVATLLAAIAGDDCEQLLNRTGHALAPLLRKEPALPHVLVEGVLRTADPVLVRSLAHNDSARPAHQDLWRAYADKDEGVVGSAWRAYDAGDDTVTGGSAPDNSAPDGPNLAVSTPEPDPVDTEATRFFVAHLYQVAKEHKGRRDLSWNELQAPRHAIRDQRGLDWPTVREAHRARRLRPDFVEHLLERPDCPEDVLAELAPAVSRPLDFVLGLGRPLSAATVRPLLRTVASAETLTTLVAQRLGRDVSGADLLAEARPARTVLKLALERTGDAPGKPGPGPDERAGWAEFQDRLTELVTGGLADNVAAWRALRGRLPKYDGSVTELVEEALAAAPPAPASPSPTAPDTAWPDAAETPGFFDTPSLHVNRAAFVLLLNAASTDVQWMLLPHLDDRTRYDLLAQGEWRNEWLSRAIAEDDRPILVLLSRHLHLSTEVIESLAALDDPAVNAGLIYQRHATDEQKWKLASGTPFTPGRAGPLPIDPDLRKLVLGIWYPYQMLPLLQSRDAELVSYALRMLKLPQNRVLRWVLERWERYGPDGLLELLPETIQKGVRTLVTELVEDPDPERALGRLRDAVHDAESPKHLFRRLRSGASPADLRAEGFRWDWDALIAEHRTNPFDVFVLPKLQALDDCPERLRRSAPVVLNGIEQRAMKALAGGKPAATVLTKTPVRDHHSWALHAVRLGCLPPVDVLRHGQPAYRALDPGLVDDAYRAELAALVHEHLAGRPEAWVVVLTLLPDFAGTVPELLRTVALATAP